MLNDLFLYSGKEMVIRRLLGDKSGTVYAYANQSLWIENQFSVSKLLASVSLAKYSTCWMADRLYMLGEGR